MPTIRKYNKETEKYKRIATSDALEVAILDAEGNFESDNVEGALRELGDAKGQIEVNRGIIDAVNSTLTDHIKNHPGGGGGGGTMPTISTDWNETSIDGDKDFTIPIYFTSPNLGEGTLYVLINNVETSIQTISQGNNTIKIPALGSGKKRLSIYVRDRGQLMSNQLTWDIVCGGIKLTVTMNTDIDYTLKDRILLTYNIDCDLQTDINTIITIDGTEYTVKSNKGYNSYEIKGLTVGVHKVEIYATADVYSTPSQVFNVIIVATEQLFITSTFDTTKQYEKGQPMNINYRVSIANTDYYTINMYVDDFEKPIKTLSQQPGNYYWTFTPEFELGKHTLRIEAYNSDKSKTATLDLPFELVASSYQAMEYVSTGLIASFNAKNRTNSDVDRGYWVDDINGYIGRLYNSNYGTNGWIDGELVLNGNTYVEIDMTPFSDNVTRGFTLDMVFSVEDIGNPLARVIDCTSLSAPYPGLYVNPYKANLATVSHKTELDIGQGEDIQITFMIDRVSKFGKVFINGVCCDPFQLSDSSSGSQIIYEQIKHAEKIYLNSEKGTSNFGSCKIKRIMMYERELSDEEVLQNRIADMKIEEQEEEYNKNYNDAYMPCMYIYGDISNMTLTNKKEVRIKYVSPNADLYGSSFEYPRCKMYWQGTSSIQYANKNFNIELGDSDGNQVFYTPFKNGILEYLFCLKCNQMESSNVMNTGSAMFVNDNLYVEKNPAQLKNDKVRQAIEGFPMLLYINDEFVGLYDFNLDRYSYRSYGYNLFDKCLAYEVSANSDTTAGAFNSWTSSSGKTEQNYYASDFECLYPPSRQNGNDNFAELKTLVDFVSGADEDLFKEQFDTYFDRQSVFRYYLFVQVFGGIDSLGKNMKIVTFDGVKWYLQVYDLDSLMGLDNTGALTFDVDIEVESGVFNTSNSKLWSKIRLYFANELKQEYINMRNGVFTLENMYKYFYDNQMDKIPVRYYNKSTEYKYLRFGAKYLYACHGNRYFQIKRWLKERLLYCDTLFGYEPSTSNFVTVRCNKQGKVSMDISTYSPMYLSVKWRDEADGSGTQTLKIPRNKSVKFSYTIPTATDQEVIIYGAEYIKSLGDLSTCNPTHLLLSNATRINEVICRNSSKLVNAEINGCDYLQKIDFNGCSNLGSLTSYQVMELATCQNLKYLDIRGTKMTGVNFDNNGGNLEEIYLPKTITSLYLRNQYALKIVGLTSVSWYSPYHTEALSGASDITSFTLINCPLVERLTSRTDINMNGWNQTFYDFNGNKRSGDTLGDYEDATKYRQMALFGLGLCNATSIHIENSMLSTKYMSFRFNYRLEELTLKYLPNLQELTIGETQTGHVWNSTDDMCGSFDFNNINITECPNIKTFRIHQYDERETKWFNSGTNIIDLTKFENLETFTCNITTQDLDTILLPSTLKTIWIKLMCGFTTAEYPNKCSKAKCTLKNIYFKEDHPNGYEGIDFGNRELTELCLSGVIQSTGIIKGVNTKNTYVSPVFNNMDEKERGSELYPQVKVQGKINLSNYDWTEAYWWFTNVDFTSDNLEFIMPNDWDYLIDTRLKRVRGIFFDCKNSDFTWEFAGRFFKLLQNRDDLGRTYKYAILQEQSSYEEQAVTIENNYDIADYNYGDTPFVGSNLKYIRECNFKGNAIAYGTFRSSNLVKVGTITCSGSNVWWSSESLFQNSKNLEEVECINMTGANSTTNWFASCPKLKRVGTVNVNAKNINQMYAYCPQLTELALPTLTNLERMSGFVRGCTSLTELHLNEITENTPLEYMDWAFRDCPNLTSVTIGGTTLPPTLVTMEGAYYGDKKLTKVIPLPNDFSNKCSMRSCCYGCSSLTDDNIYKTLPYNVSNMDYIYYACHGLTNPSIVVNSDRTSSQCCFEGCGNMKSVRAEFNGTYSYGFNNFCNNCGELTDAYIKFPYSLYFNDDAQTCSENGNIFAYCKKLINVELNMTRLESKSDFRAMFRQDKYIESIKGFDLSNLHRDDRRPNDDAWYFTYDTSFEFIKDWVFATDENGNTKKLTNSYKMYNLELTPAATIESLMNGLGTVQAETLTLGQATLNRLSEEQKANAVANGWTLA